VRTVDMEKQSNDSKNKNTDTKAHTCGR